MGEITKLVKLKDRDADAKRFTPQDALQTVMDEYNSGKLKGTKIVIVSLDDANDDYNIDKTMAGMHGAETVALLEAAKYTILKRTFE